jgi:hypothetical protein
MEVLTIRLTGHLTREAFEANFAGLHLPDHGMMALVVDCLPMTGYDIDARHAFVEWNREHKARIRAVAVVTPKVIWQMVVGAMSLASGQTMKAFDTEPQALAWLETFQSA